MLETKCALQTIRFFIAPFERVFIFRSILVAVNQSRRQRDKAEYVHLLVLQYLVGSPRQ